MKRPGSKPADLRLNPLYKRLLMLAIVLGPIIWLVFTQDGQRRTDLVLLYLFGKDELNLAIENLHSDMTEAQFRALFPDLDLACDDGANPFGDRLCTTEIGAFSAIPARAFTLFLEGDRLRAAKVNYRRSYHEVLKRQLTGRLGTASSAAFPGSVREEGPVSWAIGDGVLLLPPEEPHTDADAALLWLSKAAVRYRLESSDAGDLRRSRAPASGRFGAFGDFRGQGNSRAAGA